ncbi:MAG: hypothetical protein ABH868_03875 [bacterium]
MMDFKNFCQFLSDYMENELEADICRDMEELMGEDFCCRCMLKTFNKTLELCREMEQEMIEVPEHVHIRLYEVLHIEIQENED